MTHDKKEAPSSVVAENGAKETRSAKTPEQYATPANSQSHNGINWNDLPESFEDGVHITGDHDEDNRPVNKWGKKIGPRDSAWHDVEYFRTAQWRVILASDPFNHFYLWHSLLAHCARYATDRVHEFQLMDADRLKLIGITLEQYRFIRSTDGPFWRSTGNDLQVRHADFGLDGWIRQSRKGKPSGKGGSE